MLRKTMDIRQRYHPIPLTVLITTANSCDCDIFVEYEASRVNVKDYEAMIRNFDTHAQSQLFFSTAVMSTAPKSGSNGFLRHNT